MLNNRAVYQDITRAALRSRGYEGPVVSPREAARHLVGIAKEHHFTLFEYFQTDRAGHAGNFENARRILRVLDRFLAELAVFVADEDLAFMLSSDHGNIEDLSVSGHTDHPVPLAVFGRDAGALQVGVCSLTDIAPAIRAWLADGEGAGR